MTLSDLIQLGLLLVTVTALLWSQYSDRQQRKLSMFAEYTKRYQDVILSMPDCVLMGSADVKTDVLKHLQLYFDLCTRNTICGGMALCLTISGNLGMKGCVLPYKTLFIKKHGTNSAMIIIKLSKNISTPR